MKGITVAIILFLPIVCYSQVTYLWASSDSGKTNMKEYTTGIRTEKISVLKTKGDHKSHIVKNELVAMMDTVTCNIRGNITSLSTNYMIDIVLELKQVEMVYKGYSDKAGNFEIMHIPSGNYDLQINANGYKKLIYRNLVIKSGGIYNWEIYLACKNLNRDYQFFKIK